MVSLSQDNKGKYRARKRLPDDVREEYGRLYGARHEAKFSAPTDVTKQEAIRRYGVWLAEIEARISSIRAQRNDHDMSSSRLQTRALAGDCYRWFIKRHPSVGAQVWLELREFSISFTMIYRQRLTRSSLFHRAMTVPTNLGDDFRNLRMRITLKHQHSYLSAGRKSKNRPQARSRLGGMCFV
jgi:hypothetical protein